MGLPSCQKSSGRSFFGGTQQTFGNSETSRPKIFVTLARASGVSGRNRHFDRRRSRIFISPSPHKCPRPEDSKSSWGHFLPANPGHHSLPRRLCSFPHGPDCPAPNGRPHGRTGSPAGAGTPALPMRSFRTVTYTPLRAHETGRKLVCRLLVEKKKKQDDAGAYLDPGKTGMIPEKLMCTGLAGLGL